MFPETNIMSYFAELINIVTIAILGVICGAEGWVDIERYGNAKKDWLSGFLDLEKGIPSHDSFGQFFRWLDEAVFKCVSSNGQPVSVSRQAGR